MKKAALLAFLLIAAPACADEVKVQMNDPVPVPAAGAAPVRAPDAAPAPAPVLAPEAAGAQKWDVIAAKSSITFHGTQMGSKFDGVIKKFTPVIVFDPGHLDQSKVTVDIDISSIDAQDPERNKSISGPDWFDAAQFPTARFETTKFTKTGDNAFTADATLTIRGVSVPVQLPFTLTKQAVGFGQDRTVMNGAVTLDRSKFQLGQGDWADPSVIANEVPVEVQITATPAAR